MDELLGAPINPSDIPTGRFSFVADTAQRIPVGDNALLFKELSGTITAIPHGRRIVFNNPKPQVEANILLFRTNVDIGNVAIFANHAIISTRWKTATVRWE